MKKMYSFFVAVLCSQVAGYSQEWTHYYQAGIPSALAHQGDTLWIGTLAGLMAIDKSAGAIISRYNSPLLAGAGNISGIAVDMDGSKWLSFSFGGIARFDGSQWEVFNMENSPLPDNYIHDVAIDSAGNKWIGTYGSGLVKFDGSDWIVYNMDNSSLPGNAVKTIEIDPAGNVWVGTDQGLAKFDGSNWTVFNVQNGLFPTNFINDIATSMAGTVWVATENGLVKLDTNGYTSYTPDNTPTLLCWQLGAVALDAGGHPWVGCLNGMFQFQDSIFTLHSPVPPGPPLTGVWEISFAEDGVVWLAGYGGFMSYDGSAWTFHELSNMPPIGGVRDLAIAQSGAAWVVGETSASAASFNDGTWEVFNSSNSPISSLPLSIAIDQNDGKWIGTFGGLVHNDGSGWNVFNSSNTCLSSNIIRNIVIDQTGKKWLGHGSSTGLTAFDGTSCVNYNSTNSPVGSVRAITIDKNNSVWVGIGSNGGVAKFDGTWTQYNLPSSFSIRSMAIDSANVLWVGTEGDGIFSFNGNDWHHFNSSNTEIPDDFVNDITVDATGAKWLATDSGLAHFDGTEWTIYDVSNSPLPNNKISAITADKDGNLWLACAGLVLIKGAFEPVANKEAKPALKSSPLKISPNPTCGIFKVEFQEPLPGDFLLLVNDSQGRLFRREMLENTPGFQWHVDLSGLAAGVYLVTACSSEVSFSQKIVKQ